MCLVLVELYLVQDNGIRPDFRKGIASDYVHLLGRLLSSSASRALFGNDAGMRASRDEPLAREAVRIARELAADNSLELGSDTDLLFTDALIPSALLS